MKRSKTFFRVPMPLHPDADAAAGATARKTGSRSLPAAIARAMGVAASFWLVACATLEPASTLAVGQTEAQVQQAMGAATGRYALPSGVTRLEFARGPAGRTTWMVDLDASGRVTAFEQVLHEASFLRATAGMSTDELLRLFGRPAHRAIDQGRRETWYWRYPTNDCLWFNVTFSPEGRTLAGGGYMTDPSCDFNDSARP